MCMDKAYYRILAVDYGDVRIGLALSDLTRIIASPYETYTRQNTTKDLQYIADLVKEKQVGVVVFGLPLNMDGSEGDRALKTRTFAQKLSELVDCKIDFCDERLSSVSAENILLTADVSRQKRKQVIDKLAATIILQEYLDAQ